MSHVLLCGGWHRSSASRTENDHAPSPPVSIRFVQLMLTGFGPSWGLRAGIRGDGSGLGSLRDP